MTIASLTAVSALVLLGQVLAATGSSQRRTERLDGNPGPVAVLMPAHDESIGIAASIASVLPQLRRGDRLLVVADNCTDATATVARTAGAEVVERHDPARRGKGYALDFGIRYLGHHPPAVVVVVDADCTLRARAVERLARASLRSGRPTQALYLMHCSAGAGLRARIAEFAWIVRNHVRPLGALRLGLPCQLMGTGMAFPWPLIEGAPLASGNLVEDLELGLHLAAAGYAPVFCPEAQVDSVFPDDGVARAAQRTRWEHGHLSMIASAAPRLLWIGLRHRTVGAVALAVDLCVPPLASFVLIAAVLAGLGGVLAALGGPPAPCIVASGTLSVIVASVLLAWARFGRSIVSLRELLASPAYVVAKVPMYARLFKSRQAEWIRTRRDDKGG